MLRKMMIALMATVALGVLAPDAASARGGGGGGGGHGGGGFGGGGWHGGGFGGGGWHGGVAAFHGVPMGGAVAFHHAGFGPGFHPGFHRRVFIGGGYVPYGYDDGYYADYGYPDQVYYDDGGGYVEQGSCMIVHHRVHTRHGWRYRTVQVCQ